MSIKNVQTAIVRQIQQDTNVDLEFKKELTGIVSSSGTTVTGSGTVFDKELLIDDYIGTTANGYRRVKAIDSPTSITIDEAFDIEFADSIINKTNISPGIPTTIPLATIGKGIYIGFDSSNELFAEISGGTVDIDYAFVIVMAFIEANAIDADIRKSAYEKLIKDAICKDTTFGGICFDDTTIGKFKIFEAVGYEGYYFGVLPIITTKNEDADNR